MDIKFFLPYYIGRDCEVFWTKESGVMESEGFGKIISIRFDPHPAGHNPVGVRKLIRANGNMMAEYAYGYHEVKPVLLPVSAMNGGTCRWWYQVRRDAMDKFRGPNHSGSHAGCVSAAETHYLLSCGFDLFGLIDAGLAHDKTKLPSSPPQY